MTEYLGHLPSFSVTADSVDEVVTKSGQKLQFPGTSQVYVQRPDRLRSDRLGVPMDISLYYDGSTLSLFGRKAYLYASTDAPPTLDEAIDFARKRLNLDAPGADLLYGDAFEVLTEDMVSARYVGREQVDGVMVHHLAFAGNETDWEIWIEDGARPLPRRFVITSKKVKESPQFTVRFSDWNVTPLFSSDVFTFQPPKGAERIDIDEVWERAAEIRSSRAQ